MSQILANVSTMNRFGPEYSTPDISCSKETAVRLKALKLHPTFDGEVICLIHAAVSKTTFESGGRYALLVYQGL